MLGDLGLLELDEWFAIRCAIGDFAKFKVVCEWSSLTKNPHFSPGFAEISPIFQTSENAYFAKF